MEDDASIVIRWAEPGDAETICRISHEAYRQFRRTVRPPFQALRVKPGAVSVEIESLTSVYGLAVVDGEPVGHVRYRPRGDYLAISRLAVLPKYRRRGIGTMLMRWLEDEARRWDVRRLRGEVRTIFPRLLRYYLDMGYRVVGYVTLAGIPRCLTRIEKVITGPWVPPVRVPQPVPAGGPSHRSRQEPAAVGAARRKLVEVEPIALQILHPALRAILSGACGPSAKKG